MGTLFLIAADPEPSGLRLPRLVPALGSVPAGLVAALVIIAGSYWGLHGLFYGADALRTQEQTPGSQLLTHLPNAEHPHVMATPPVSQ